MKSESRRSNEPWSRRCVGGECRLDRAPTLADQFIFGVAPIDYSQNKRQISRVKLGRLPHAAAGLTTSAFDGYGTSPSLARRAPCASDPVLVHRPAPLLHASFRPSVAGTPLGFAMTSPPSGCQGDFQPRAVEHVRHTKKQRSHGSSVCAGNEAMRASY